MPPSRRAAAVTDRFRARLAALRDGTARIVTARWSNLDLDRDLAEQFEGWVEEAATMVELAQLRAARLSSAYLDAYLTAAGLEAGSEPPDPNRYVGADMDGKPLDQSFTAARGAALWMLARRQGRDRALSYGLNSALRISRSAVMEAARTAQSDRMNADPSVTGWRRVTSGAPCGACIALAGRLQSTEETFDRHDRCQCTAEPVLSGIDETLTRPSGRDLLRRMSPAQLRSQFGTADVLELVDREGLDVLITRTGGRVKQAPKKQIA